MRYRNKKAFTIVELVIVIAVIGILAGVLIPTFITVVRKSKISRAEQNATNLSLLLATEAAFDGLSYYPAEQVISKAEENGFDLGSGVKGYAYFYDAAKNRVVYGEVVNSDALAEGEEFTRTLRNVSHASNLFYIERSSNPITVAIEKIERLASECNYDREAMIDEFEALVTNNEKLDGTVRRYLERFNPKNTVYITANGLIYDEETTEYDNAVVCLDAQVVPKLRSGVNITITDPIVIPSTVMILEDGSFTGITATLEVNSALGYDETRVSLDGSLTIRNKAASQSGDVVPLSSGDYSVIYGIAKEAKDAAGITYRITADFDDEKGDYDYLTLGDLSAYQAGDNLLVGEYIVPSVSLRNNSFVNFGDIKKITVRASKVEGGTEYVLVAVDKDFNVYKLREVGVLNYSSLVYERDPENSEKIVLSFGEDAVSFVNLSGMYAEIEYQYGYAELEPLELDLNVKTTYTFKGVASWSDEVLTERVGNIKAVNDLTLELPATIDHFGESKECNVANVSKVTVFTSDGVAIYSAYYPRQETVTPVTVTLNNNLAGEDNEVTLLKTYKDFLIKLNYGKSLDTDTQMLVSWNTAPDGSGKSYDATSGERYAFDQDVTLYAIYEKMYTFTIKYRFPMSGKIYSFTMTFNKVRVGETFTASSNGNVYVRRDLTGRAVESKGSGLGDYATYLETLGFDNFHTVVNGRSNGYYYGYLGTEVIDGKEGTFTFTEELAAYGTADNNYTAYGWIMAYTDVKVYDAENNVAKVYEDRDWYGIFRVAYADSEKFYSDEERTQVILNASITAGTIIKGKDYYGE